MTIMGKKITFGLIVGTRGFFNPKPAQKAREQLPKKLDSHSYSYVILPDRAASNGALTLSHRAKVLPETISKYMKWDLCFHE